MTSLLICWNCGEKVKIGSCEKCGVEVLDPNTVQLKAEYAKNVSFEIPLLEKGNTGVTNVIYIILFLNIAFYMYTTYLSGSFIISDEIYNKFGSSSFAIEDGQYYVLFTSFFIHNDPLHIIFNMSWMGYLAFQMGSMGYSNKSLLGSYLLIGLLESFFVAYIDISSVTVGASGAVFGWVGIYIAILRRRNNIDWKKYLMFVGIYMIISLISPRISFWGHLIGFLLGWGIGSLPFFDRFKQK